jgi:amino acid transporter
LTSSVALFGGVSVLLSGQARMINDIEKSLSVPVSGLGVGAVTAACVYFCSMEQMSVLTNVVLTIVVIIINMALIKYHYENKEHKLSLPFEVGRVALFPVISTVLCVVMLYLVNGHSRG